jgi:hypothetical protein
MELKEYMFYLISNDQKEALTKTKQDDLTAFGKGEV